MTFNHFLNCTESTKISHSAFSFAALLYKGSRSQIPESILNTSRFFSELSPPFRDSDPSVSVIVFVDGPGENDNDTSWLVGFEIKNENNDLKNAANVYYYHWNASTYHGVRLPKRSFLSNFVSLYHTFVI